MEVGVWIAPTMKPMKIKIGFSWVFYFEVNSNQNRKQYNNMVEL